MKDKKGKSKKDVQLARTKERRELVIGSYLIHRPLISPTHKYVRSKPWDYLMSLS